MTADHHDRELWERYFKPCKNTNLQLHVSKGLTQLQWINRTYDASQHTMHIIITSQHTTYIMQFSLRKSRIKITSLTLTWKVDDSLDNSQYASQHIP